MLLLCACLAAQADPVDDLHSAARGGDIGAIRKLVSEGVDIDAPKQSEGGTPLHTATNWNNFEAVKTLISLGANVNSDSNQPALLRAAGRDTRIVKLLIAAGADVNYAEPKFRYTALSSAAGQRRETFEALTKSGSYTGPFPDTLETVRLLIKAGADPNHVDAFSESPLRIAMRRGNTEIARLLLQAGASVNQKISAGGTQRGDTVLMETISYYAVYKDVSAIRLLLDHGANPNDRNEMDYREDLEEGHGERWRGYSVLSYAAKHGLYGVVKLLLERGADPMLSRTDGATAYELSLQEKHPKTAALLNSYLQRTEKTP